MEMQSLKGRIALVKGGSTGLGFGVAKKLIGKGAVVSITGRRQAELDRAFGELGSSATAIQADAANKADMLRVAETDGSQRHSQQVGKPEPTRCWGES